MNDFVTVLVTFIKCLAKLQYVYVISINLQTECLVLLLFSKNVWVLYF